MQKPEKPANEAQRLRALHLLDILDSASEERFDRLTRLCQRCFGTETVLISLVDENRQWFKSCQGMGPRETSRDISFCGHAIHCDEIMEVPDTRLDERFSDNPLVTGPPHIRFYAGAPLHSADGFLVGTLCLIDSRPRQLTADEHHALRDFADAVESEMNRLTEARAQEQLARQEARLRTLFELSPIGISLSDYETGQFIDLNDALVKPTGYTREELLQHGDWDLTPVEYQNSEEEARQELKTLGQCGPYEKEFTRKDGSCYPVRIQSTLSHDADGRDVIWSLIEDITELKRIDQMKNEFISTVSHELRTPLTSISGSLSLIRSGAACEVPAPMRDMLEIAYNNSHRLKLLINDLLDMERLVSGRMTIQMTSQPLVPIIQSAVRDTQAYADQFEVTFEFEPPDSDPTVRVDADRLHQVLANLLSNAAKFSPEGETVTIEVSTRSDAVQVSVVDHGPGIPDSFRSRLFEKFSQLDASDRRARSGTGLGLAISKELIQQMDGRIDVESTAGSGSRFYFELPLSGTTTA